MGTIEGPHATPRAAPLESARRSASVCEAVPSSDDMLTASQNRPLPGKSGLCGTKGALRLSRSCLDAILASSFCRRRRRTTDLVPALDALGASTGAAPWEGRRRPTGVLQEASARVSRGLRYCALLRPEGVEAP